MKEFMESYEQNKKEIEKFLIETVYNLGSLSTRGGYDKLFKVFPSLELLYVCNKSDFKQISPNIYKSKTTDTATGRDRKYLLEKVSISDGDISITRPYRSSATGETCITVIKIEDNSIFFLDFNLITLLERFGLVEIQREFNLVSKGFYFIASSVMIILALFTIGYSFFDFFSSVFIKGIVSVESIFKPIISITLALAVFDLGKTVMEQEVIFKSYSKNSKLEYKVLTKFSITIIIALLIESLMVVFKIALDDYTAMISAMYLIIAVSVLIIALSIFIYLSKKRV